MTINTILLMQLRAHLRRNHILSLTVAAIPGIPLGVYILKHADVRILEMLLGILLVVFSVYFVWSGEKLETYPSLGPTQLALHPVSWAAAWQPAVLR